MKHVKISKIYLFSCVVIFLFPACNRQHERKAASFFPSDKYATNTTGRIYSKLGLYLDKGVMLGHQDALAYGNAWYGDDGRSDVKTVCGDYPAVFGWDIGKIETGSSLNVDSVSFDNIRFYILEAHRLGGISTISWCADNPLTKGGYKDDSDSRVVEAILCDKETHERYLMYLDHLALFFNSLKDTDGDKIPVIFRPFHDHNSKNKYWWNSEQATAEDFKKMWTFTVNYLRDKKGVHNVLYTYSVYSDDHAESFTEYYPGNEYVDFVGTSSFLLQKEDPSGAAFMQTLNKSLFVVTRFAEENHKIPAITCTGLEGIKIPNFFTKYIHPIVSQHKVSYILFWRNAWNIEQHYFIPIPGHPADEDFIHFVKQDNVLTCSNLN